MKTRGRFVGDCVIHGTMLFIVLAVLLPGPFFRGELLSSADILYQVEPWSAYAPPDFAGPHNSIMTDPICAFRPYYVATAAALDHSEWPLWNPYQYMGVPLLANCQSAVFYPMALLFRILDTDAAMSWAILLKLWLCGMTAYVCGRGLALSRLASVFLSLAWMLGGYNWVWAFWPLPDVSAWLPVVFLGVEWIRQGRYRPGTCILACGGTLLLYGGHPETAFAMGLGVGAYYLLRTLLSPPGWRSLGRQGMALGLGWGLALAVTLPMTLPFAEYLVHSSTFAERGAGETVPPLDALSSGTLFVPRLFGTHADGNYMGNHDTNRNVMLFVGITVWLFATLAVAYGWRDTNRRNEALALAAPSFLGLLLAFGAWPIGFLLGHQPFASLLPTYNGCFFVFAMPLLAARGVDVWRGPAIARPWKSFAVVVAVFLAGCALVGFVYSLTEGLYTSFGMLDYVRWQLTYALGIGVLAIALLAAGLVRPLGRVGAAGICVVLMCELAIAGRGLNPSMAREAVYPATQLTDFLRDLGHPVRIGFTDAGIPSGVGTSYGIEEQFGYDGLFPARIVEYQKALGRDIWVAMEPMYAIRYYLENPRIGALVEEEFTAQRREVASFDGVRAMESPTSQPRAIVVPSAEVVPDREEMYRRMRDPAYDPTQRALLEKPLSASLGGGTGEAEITGYTSNTLTATVTADHAALLVLSEAWYPGWKATVDGTPAEVVPVNRVFRGIAVPGGTHTVTLRYDPWTFRAGLAASSLAMAASWLYGLWYVCFRLVARARRGALESPTYREGEHD